MRRLRGGVARLTGGAARSFAPVTPLKEHMGLIRVDRFSKQDSSGRNLYGDHLGLWVADMDFKAPENILQAIRNRADLGVFGYTQPTHEDYDAVLTYLHQRHSLPDKYSRDMLNFLPGLVTALNVCSRAFAGPNEAIMAPSPVYPPFFLCPKNQGRLPHQVLLVKHPRTNKWDFDFEAMEQRCRRTDLPAVRALILCNPHNPLGRVFTKDELVALLDFCRKWNMVVISDEIHCDLVLDPQQRHVSALGLGYDEIVVCLMSPTKTFNLAACGASVVIIPDQNLRTRFLKSKPGLVSDLSAFGMVALRAAYKEDASFEWQAGLVAYLKENRDVLGAGLDQNLLKFDFKSHEATYLAWIDCRELMKRVGDQGQYETASKFFLDQCNIAFNDGRPFVNYQEPWAKDFIRFNFACHRDVVIEALDRVGRAIRPYR